MKSTPIVAVAAGLALVLTACGPQTDDRVADTSPPESSLLQVEPTDGASTAPQSPYVTFDCASLEGTQASEPPAGGATVGDVTATTSADAPPTITVATGAQPATELGIADLAEGTGDTAAAGDELTVDYCGVGLDSLSVFDSSFASGEPVTFPLDGLIAGWQEGLPGMKVGGTRLLVIPGALGYGEAGAGPIGPDETLAFVIHLRAVTPSGSSPAAS